MNTDQKITVAIVIAVVVCVLTIVAYNTYDSTIRSEAYKHCVDTNARIIKDNPSVNAATCWR